jgi:adenylosuccinate lyase
MELSGLTAISPIDGRYGSKTESLRAYFSEFALMKHRVVVEIEWLKWLSAEKAITEVAGLSAEAISVLDTISKVHQSVVCF